MRGCGRSVSTVYEEAAEPELRHPPAQRGRLKVTGKCLRMSLLVQKKLPGQVVSGPVCSG